MTAPTAQMPRGAYSSQQGRAPMVGPTGRTGSKVKGYNIGQIQNMTPEQMQIMQQMGDQVGPNSYLARMAGGDQSMYEEMEAPAMKQFSALQGQMGSRFSGMGQGGRNSSGFQNSMNQAGSDFAGQLQSQRLELRNKALKDLMGMSSDLLDKKPYETTYTQKDPKTGGWGGAMSGAASGASAGSMFGPWGTAIGGIAGGVGGYFSK